MAWLRTIVTRSNWALHSRREISPLMIKRMRSMQRMARTLLPLVAVLAFLGGAVLMLLLRPSLVSLWSTRSQNRSEQPPNQARLRVNALGRIEPHEGLVNLAGTPGDRIATILVKVGDQVDQGQNLVRLASHALREAEAAQIQAQLDAAQSQAQATQTYGKSQIAEAKASLAQLNSSQRTDVQLQQQQLEALTQKLDFARQELSRLQSAGSGVTVRQRAQQAFAVQQAQAAVETAKLQHRKAEQSRDLAIQSAHLQLETAKANLTRLLAEIPTTYLQKSLELVQLQQANATLKAPRAGTILQIHSQPGEQVGTQPILTLASLEPVMVRAEVYETDLPLLRQWFADKGVQASIHSKVLEQADAEKGLSSAASPSRTLTGRVVHIDSIIGRNEVFPVNPVEDMDRRVADVLIQLDNAERAAQYLHLQVNVTLSPLESN